MRPWFRPPVRGGDGEWSGAAVELLHDPSSKAAASAAQGLSMSSRSYPHLVTRTIAAAFRYSDEQICGCGRARSAPDRVRWTRLPAVRRPNKPGWRRRDGYREGSRRDHARGAEPRSRAPYVAGNGQMDASRVERCLRSPSDRRSRGHLRSRHNDCRLRGEEDGRGRGQRDGITAVRIWAGLPDAHRALFAEGNRYALTVAAAASNAAAIASSCARAGGCSYASGNVSPNPSLA